jgi:trehalose-6-phosphate synthase
MPVCTGDGVEIHKPPLILLPGIVFNYLNNREVLVFLEIAFTNKDRMTCFPPHCQDLGVSILLSHQHPDKRLYNFTFSITSAIGTTHHGLHYVAQSFT